MRFLGSFPSHRVRSLPGAGLLLPVRASGLLPALLLALAMAVPASQGALAQAASEAGMGTPLARSAVVAPLQPALAPASSTEEIPHPTDIIGFELGSDYMLADLEQLYSYYRALAAASPRVEMEEIGRSWRGEPLYLLYISSEENLAQLDRWREISERLARARDLTPEEARALAREGKAIVWIDAGLHSAEVATAQHAPLLAYHMATDGSEESRRIRDDVILLLMPMMNPDGHRIMVDWYRSVARTEHEFTSTPEVWHEYVGHDINRDWYMIRHQETVHIAHQLYERWYPQIVFNHHQHSPFPTWIFIPPFSDPLNPHIHPLVVRGVNMVGEHMAQRFEQLEMPGVVQGLTFTMWWNGGMRTAPYFHNQIGILSEVAHRFASPRYHDPEDLPEFITAGARRISTREPSIYYANPWEGGWARLGMAVEYHFVSSMGTLDIGSLLKETWLYNKYLMGSHQIRDGKAGGPFAYVVSLEDQWDRGEAVEMLNVLRRGGVEIHRATEPFLADGRQYPAGSYLAFAGQAFRPHLMDLMEPQEHPHRELYPGGPPEPPYGGLAGWTLPMQMAVRVDRVEEPFQVAVEVVDRVPAPESRVVGVGGYGYAISAQRNDARAAAWALLHEGERVHLATGAFQVAHREMVPGAFVVEAGTGTSERVRELAAELGLDVVALDSAPAVELEPLRPPRLAMYMPWTGNMDEGWTRYIFHQFGMRPDTVRNHDLHSGDLSRWDVIVFADQAAMSIFNGHPPDRMPEAYVGGVGQEGAARLREWVEGGGTLVTFDGASDFAIQALELPVANATQGMPRDELFVPGSLIRTVFDGAHPVAFGMTQETAAFYQNSRAWEVLDPHRVDVVGRYADADLLMSGWEIGADEHLASRPAVVRVRAGKGQAVLIGFRPQFRAQPTGTYKLFFNAILGAGAENPDALLNLRGSAAAAHAGAH